MTQPISSSGVLSLATFFFSLLILGSPAAARDYDVRDHGAVGDAETLDTKAIQAAIDKCAAETSGVWEKTAVLPAAEARQAAAADTRFVYAISNRRVTKYDRVRGQRVAESRGEATHLNSGFFRGGKLHCAHSNFPEMPEQSGIMVLDTETMELSTLKDFGLSEGSLTWAVYHENHWWCNFAYYQEQNHRTYLVEYNDRWEPRRRWRYPPEVIARLGRFSVSGGLWWEGTLLVTGHDAREVYRLRVPEDEGLLEYVETLSAPFTGQGIAADPATGGLVGIDRRQRRVVFAAFRPE